MDLAIFDLDGLRHRAGYDDELVSDALATFLATPDPLPALRAAHASAAADTLVRGAHKLKGTLLALGANRAADAASALERLAKGNDVDAIPDAIETLAVQLIDAKTAMERAVDSAKSMTQRAS